MRNAMCDWVASFSKSNLSAYNRGKSDHGSTCRIGNDHTQIRLALPVDPYHIAVNQPNREGGAQNWPSANL